MHGATLDVLDLTLKDLKVFLQNEEIVGVLFSRLCLVLKLLRQPLNMSILERHSPLIILDDGTRLSNLSFHALEAVFPLFRLL